MLARLALRSSPDDAAAVLEMAGVLRSGRRLLDPLFVRLKAITCCADPPAGG